MVECEAPTREILTVLTQSTTDQTAFFDPDPSISPAEAEALADRVEHALSAGNVSALTLSGSSPSAATHGIYSDLISLAKARRIPVFLDTYGPALEGIWGFWPSVIQLNRKEAAGQLRKQTATDGDVLGLLENWHRHGVTCGIVTDGPNPAIIQSRHMRFKATPPPIKAVNPIGSGDSLPGGPGRRLAGRLRHRADDPPRHGLRGGQRRGLGRRRRRPRAGEAVRRGGDPGADRAGGVRSEGLCPWPAYRVACLRLRKHVLSWLILLRHSMLTQT